jgi:hypothetical protein
MDLISHEMWKKYNEGNYKAMDALYKIIKMQPILSGYYDASRMVMEREIRRTEKESSHDDIVPSIE